MKSSSFFSVIFIMAFFLLTGVATASAKDLSTVEAKANYKFKDNGTSVNITAYTGSEVTVTIPDKINGRRVTKIDENAFSANQSIHQVIMGKYINTIGWGAFRGCVNLEAVTFNQGLCYIDDGAFSNTAFITVDFPSTLRYIGFLSFGGDTKLTTIRFASNSPVILPKSFGEVLSIDLPSIQTIEISKSATGYDDAAWKQSGLTSYFVKVEDPDSTARKAVKLETKDIVYTLNGNEMTIISYLGIYSDILIPKTIGGKKVVKIAKGAFSDCGTLRSVQFGANMREIGESAFENCLNLEAVQFNYGLKYIQTAAFQNTRIKKLIIPSTVSVINCFAFNNVSTLESLTFYGNAPEIGGDTFGINWWGNPMPKLKQMNIAKDATGFDGTYWMNRGLADIVSRMSSGVGEDGSTPQLLKAINLKVK